MRPPNLKRRKKDIEGKKEEEEKEQNISADIESMNVLQEEEEKESFMDTSEKKEEEEEDTSTKIFFDFETYQEREVGETKAGKKFAHEPCFCVAIKVCKCCRDNVFDGNYESCTSCGPNKAVFSGKKLKKIFKNFFNFL